MLYITHQSSHDLPFALRTLRILRFLDFPLDFLPAALPMMISPCGSRHHLAEHLASLPFIQAIDLRPRLQPSPPPRALLAANESPAMAPPAPTSRDVDVLAPPSPPPPRPRRRPDHLAADRRRPRRPLDDGWNQSSDIEPPERLGQRRLVDVDVQQAHALEDLLEGEVEAAAVGFLVFGEGGRGGGGGEIV